MDSARNLIQGYWLLQHGRINMIDTAGDLIAFLDEHYEKNEPMCYTLMSQADIPNGHDNISDLWGAIIWQVDDAMDALETKLNLAMARAINDYNDAPKKKKKNVKKKL
jgi:hypothetical protein